MKPRKLLFIVGPTASGKTELALEEAGKRGAVILSCDSLCVYRGMDIGTAKPIPAEQSRVRHFGLDLCDPEAPFSVARYMEYRDQVLRELAEAGTPVLVAGGSGFYLKSFFSPVVDRVEIPSGVEEEAARIRRESGLAGLLEALRRINPPGEAFAGLDLKNPRRVEKALIRCMAGGRSYTELCRDFAALPEPLADWEKEVWLVERPLENLQDRNRRRVGAMLEAGLVAEVESLRRRGFERNPSAAGAIGYREVLQFLDGKLSGEELPEAIRVHTNQLMRKQRTWFRRQIPVHRRLRFAES